MNSNFYNIKINAEISVDVEASDHDHAISEAQYEAAKTLKCFFGEDSVKINSVVVTGAE